MSCSRAFRRIGARRGDARPERADQGGAPGQIVVEFGSHPLPDKERQWRRSRTRAQRSSTARSAERPAWSRPQGRDLSRRRPGGLPKARASGRRLCRSCLYFGPFGAASRVKLINNLLVAIHIAGDRGGDGDRAAAGVDVDLMIKAIANGSGGSTQFGIRAPWMAQRKFMPQQGIGAGLAHYFDMIGELADEVGVATPMLDRLIERSPQRFAAMGGRPRCRRHHRVISRKPRTQDGKSGVRRIRMIRVRKIAHASYEMPDLDKQAEYYTDILGLDLHRPRTRMPSISPPPSTTIRSCCARAGRRSACASASRSAPDDDLDAFERQVQGAGHQDDAQEGSGADDRRPGHLRGSEGHGHGGVQARRLTGQRYPTQGRSSRTSSATSRSTSQRQAGHQVLLRRARLSRIRLDGRISSRSCAAGPTTTPST